MDIHGGADHEDAIDSLQKWFESNKKMPNKIDRILLTRFYYCMYKDVENTKKLLETHYSIRKSNPFLFTNRDPTDEDSQKLHSFCAVVPLPGLTPKNYRITLHHISDPDPNLVRYAEDSKIYIMLNDCRFCLPDAVIDGTPVLSAGDIHITDMSGHTMAHMRKVSFWIFRTIMKYMQQAYPVRIKAIHLINCPSYLNKILAFVKPFVSKQVFELVHFHTTGLESLYDFVPIEMLPEEYGGKAGKIADLKEDFLITVMEKREYLMDPNYWNID